MRKTEFTQLLQGIEKEVDLDLFNIPIRGDKMVFSLKDQPSLYFEILVNTGGKSFDEFVNSYSKYDKPFSVIKEHQKWVGVETIISRFIGWNNKHIKAFYDEENLPDPLEELKKRKINAFDEIGDKDASLPTSEEKDKTKAAIERFEKLLLQRFKLSDDKVEEVKNELKYLTSSVDRLNKRDWKAVAHKVINDLSTNIAANLVVDGVKNIEYAAIGHVVWQLAIDAFQILPALP